MATLQSIVDLMWPKREKSIVDLMWPKRENEQIFRFFNNDYQLMVGAAKIFSVLGESKDAGVINFQHGLAA